MKDLDNDKIVKDLLNDAFRDARNARRWNHFFRALTLLYVFGMSIWVFWERDSKTVTEEHVGVIDMIGEIKRKGGISAYPMIEALENAFENEHSKAVLLNLDSPGGSPVQSDLIYKNILRLKSLHNKPVIAVVGDVCASGCVYISAAADKIVISQNSMIGNIGVKIEGFGATGVMEKLGIERRIISAGEHKTFLDPFAPEDEFAQQHLQDNNIDVTYQNFVNVVKEGRGDKLNLADEKLFSGLVWTGKKAIDAGLADELGDLASVARELTTEGRRVDYSPSQMRLIDMFTGSAAQLAAEWMSDGVKLK